MNTRCCSPNRSTQPSSAPGVRGACSESMAEIDCTSRCVRRRLQSSYSPMNQATSSGETMSSTAASRILPRRRRRRRLFLVAVANTSHRLEIVEGRVDGAQLPADSLDEGIERSLGYDDVTVEHAHQPVAIEDVSGSGGEGPEQLELRRREGCASVADKHVALRSIEAKPADLERLRAAHPDRGPAQRGPHARDQLARRERLGDVVIGAHLE